MRKNKFFVVRCLATTLALSWVVTAAGAKVTPFADSAALAQVSGEERRVWTRATNSPGRWRAAA